MKRRHLGVAAALIVALLSAPGGGWPRTIEPGRLPRCLAPARDVTR
ncbi:MAG TPA: hypothetical protein PLU22_13910 [Polyangiaceae bacterium]|nr:hypothetical protein [Polyangiaceae bacterium]